MKINELFNLPPSEIHLFPPYCHSSGVCIKICTSSGRLQYPEILLINYNKLLEIEAPFKPRTLKNNEILHKK